MKARVVFRHIGFIGEDGGRRQTASAGEVVDLSQEEFDRLAPLGAVTKFAGGGTSAKPSAETAPAPVETPQPAARQSGNRASAKK